MHKIEKLYQIEDNHQLAEELSAYLQKAIIIENDQFELVAYSSPITQSFDPVQQKTILAKRCPLYVIERLKREGIIDRLAKEDRPIRVGRMEDIHFYERIVISLKWRAQIYGYLWLYEDEQVDPNALELLTNIAPYLAKNLHQQHHQETNQKQGFIWRLMNDEYLNEAEIFQVAKTVGFIIPKVFNVVVYSVLDARYVHLLEQVKSVLEQQGFHFYLGKGTEIIGIIHGEDRSNTQIKTEQFIYQVEASIEKKDMSSLYVGVGSTYDKINTMRRSYIEALEVIETMIFLDSIDKKIIHFKELGIYRYAKLMYKKNIAEQYRNEKLLKLMQHDINNNSALLRTLWYYLKMDAKVARTAKALFIHPNTLHYRMNKIKEITMVNLSNMDEKMELHSQLILIFSISDYYDFYKNSLQFRAIHQGEED